MYFVKNGCDTQNWWQNRITLIVINTEKQTLQCGNYRYSKSTIVLEYCLQRDDDDQTYYTLCLHAAII